MQICQYFTRRFCARFCGQNVGQSMDKVDSGWPWESGLFLFDHRTGFVRGDSVSVGALGNPHLRSETRSTSSGQVVGHPVCALR